MQPLNVEELPVDASARREMLESRTRPNPGKPNIGTAREARLAVVEERTAQCYVELEELTFRFSRLRKRMGETVPRDVPRIPRRDTH